MAKKPIQLTNDEIDTLTRSLDQEVSNYREEIKWTQGKEARDDIRGSIRILDRLGKKLVRMYHQQNPKKEVT